MKIAFTGAHCVGKTTLAEKLQTTLPDYLFIPEPYVELEEEGHIFSETPGAEDFSVQLEYAIERICIDEPDVIFDRSPLDLLAYLYVTGGAKASQNFYMKVREAMTEIDLLVFVPVEKPDLIDCPQSEFPELRQQVNELLHEWISDFDLETVDVRGTLAEREEQIIRKILELE
ncbi:MAG: hypothetical protein K0S23_3317 [Fluviicola sp.]|jgi:hypothetical protein|uniref:ATP/GTP-binding protein n=1 Tax=Fluviicola sp. TaxID=1917219 RepID=UPI0026047FD5|nr:ATP-binding protein [Fluviicola sp.]MDF3029010.1 hypothetical protein [Fluviicola sp.]